MKSVALNLDLAPIIRPGRCTECALRGERWGRAAM